MIAVSNSRVDLKPKGMITNRWCWNYPWP